MGIRPKNVPIKVNPGVTKEPDFTDNEVAYFTAADKVRFFNGKLRSIGGYTSITADNGVTISGCPRTIFSYDYNNKLRYLIGTHTRLYEFVDGDITNITPLQTSTTAIANSLDTNYRTLGTDPATTTSGSPTVTISDTGTNVELGDSITLSGFPGDLNGIPVAQLNATHTVTTAGTNNFNIRVSTSATSSGSGGGGSVVLATPIITVNATAHGLSDGDRVKIASATGPVGGIPASEINAEHVIRNTDTNTFDIVVSTKATSSVSGGGGASTTYQQQIAAGVCDESSPAGFGLGPFGAGSFGTSKTATSARNFPRIWSMGRFGNNVVMTPGGQTGIYTYDSINTVAPTALSNAPTAVNWVFVDPNSVVVALGKSGNGNAFTASNVGDSTDWTVQTGSNAFDDVIEGAEDFISHITVRAINLLFTRNQVWTARFVGLNAGSWSFDKLDTRDGLIAAWARVQVGGTVYFMGQDGFYMWDGGVVAEIPNQTIKEFVFDNLNTSQKSKCFAWVNRKFGEIWWHYPAGSSTEPDQYVIYSYREGHWTPGNMDDRTAGEGPIQIGTNPLLIDSSGTLYRHESGMDADGSALSPSAETHFFPMGEADNLYECMGMYPDSTQEGNVDMSVITKLYQQSSTETTNGPYAVSATTEKVDFLTGAARWMQVKFTQDSTSEEFAIGRWLMRVRPAGKR